MLISENNTSLPSSSSLNFLTIQYLIKNIEVQINRDFFHHYCERERESHSINKHNVAYTQTRDDNIFEVYQIQTFM